MRERARCATGLCDQKGSNAAVEIPEPGFASRSLLTCPLPGRVGRSQAIRDRPRKRRGPKDQGHKDSDGKIDQIEAAKNSQNPDVPK